MPEMKSKIQLLIVDDHQMVRQGLKLFLSSQQDFEVVAEAENGMDALALLLKTTPDVVLLDLQMPGMDGLEVISRIKMISPATEVLVLTSFIDDEKVITAIRNGATGYLMKDVSPVELERAIRNAAEGEIYLHEDATKSLAREIFSTSNQPPVEELLTTREIEVVKLVTRGLSNQVIAGNLEISPRTVKTHVSNILNKLSLESRVQIALYALRHNIVLLDEIA